MVHVFVFLGEFGFELLNWQGVVRKFARSVPTDDKIVCCSRADLSSIYESADAYIDISGVECFKNSVASAYFAMPRRRSVWYSRQHLRFDRRLKAELRRFILERLRAMGATFQDQPCSFVFSSDGVQLGGCKFGLPGYRRNLMVASSISVYRRMEAATSLDSTVSKALRSWLYKALPSLDYETTGGIYDALDVTNNIYMKAEPDLSVLPNVREQLGWDPAEPFVLCQTRRRETRQLSQQTLPRAELGKLIATLAEDVKVVLLSFDTGRLFDSYSDFEDLRGCFAYHCSAFPEQSCLIHFADHCLFFTEGDFGSHIYVPPLLGKDVTAVAPRSVYELESAPIGFWNQDVFKFGGQIAPLVSEDVFASEARILDTVQHTLAHVRTL